MTAGTQAPALEIAGTLAAHVKLHEAVSALTDADVGLPTRLPDWTVGHLLTHLARNADSVARRLAGASQNRLVEQYEGGSDGRAAEIEAGARRPMVELVADLTVADAAVDEAFRTVEPLVWGRPVRKSGQVQMPAAGLAFARWREVEVHLVDLGRGYAPADWPQPLVDRWLPDLLAGLRGRVNERALMAWTLGRGGEPGLGPWA